MRMHKVEVDDEVFLFVKSKAEPLVDTFNSALRRMLPLEEPEPASLAPADDAPKFNQAHYWVERHREYVGDPRSVGNLKFNFEQLIEDATLLQTSLREIASTLGGGSILDIGCGHGRAARPFIERGFEYFGIDVSPIAIEQARSSHPGGRFTVADLNEWESDRTFDAVCALFVFVHFVEDADWRRIVERACRAVSRGGSIIIADEFPEQRQKIAEHVTVRPLSDYTDLLASIGFEWDESFNKEIEKQVPEGSKAWHFHRACLIS